ncbi:hypothetical protein Neosp_007410 [[Neocosmospora] mangrovei]
MVSKTLHIRVDPAFTRQFNQQGYRLCFATGVRSGGSVNYNVIASTSTLIDVATNTVGITLGQSYTLNHDFTDGAVGDDSSAPKDGIRFINKASMAAAVLFKRINGQNAPIYISANAPLPPGAEDITPLSRVAVWFQNEAQTSMMISNLPPNSREMEMSFMTEATLQYTGSGSWVQG